MRGGESVARIREGFRSVRTSLHAADTIRTLRVLVTAHELGHAVTAVRVGSAIRSAGISLIFLAPVPYVDLSDLWTIPNRWHRIVCCAGGMLVEMT